ncbi:hypothetical protein GJ744_002861 [Endocarpon pusillum]|uniref:Methyltransferase n=1 Tax=Endocarpon pusillum TaxID=364733 RepID=A0A8H7ABI6_9EURO|nr:hypothetical protein GJ744_002861 [Endocarpon pusillum]
MPGEAVGVGRKSSDSDGGLEENKGADSYVLASMKFLQWQSLYEVEKPFQIFINIPDHVEDKRTTNLVFEDNQLKVKDVRASATNFSLDQHGFIYRNHETALRDFTNRKHVEESYLPEVESLLRQEADGVDEVFFFDWRLRKNAPEVEGAVIDLNNLTEWLRPAMHVHVDQSPAAVLNRIQLQLCKDADRLLRGRVRVLNVWRPLIDCVEDWPLAVCDGTTVEASDLVEADHVRRQYTGSTLYVRFNPRQEFYHMSKQRRNEVLIFKNFDSDPTKPASFAPHASFRHPHTPGIFIPRQSIEVRALVFTKAALEIS